MTKEELSKKRLAKVSSLVEAFKKAKTDDKDKILAALIIYVEEMGEVMEDLLKLVKTDKKPSARDIKEIEDTLSLGPTWLNYTRKIKRKK